MKIRYLFPVLAFVCPLLLSSCGTGGAMNDAPQNSKLTGDLPGTGAENALEFASNHTATNQRASQAAATTPSATKSATSDTLNAGEVVKVDSTEARGNSRWSDKQAATSKKSTALDRNAGVRARHSLIGSNAKNFSRVGQNMSASNPEKRNEEIYVPK